MHYLIACFGQKEYETNTKDACRVVDISLVSGVSVHIFAGDHWSFALQNNLELPSCAILIARKTIVLYFNKKLRMFMNCNLDVCISVFNVYKWMRIFPWRQQIPPDSNLPQD